MNIILHIGMNKTGTSSIQGFLSNNSEFLAKQGLVYPTVGRTTQSGEIVHSHYPFAEELRAGKIENVRAIIKEIEKEADGYDTVVISSELFHVTNPALLSEALSDHSVTVVAFIRDYVEYLSSWYREAVKSSNLACNFDYFAYTANCSYLPWLQKWESAFGKKNLFVELYSKAALRNTSSVDHFTYHYLGIQNLPETLRIDEHNPSISGNLLFIKRVLNNFISKEQANEIVQEILQLSLLDTTFRGQMQVGPEVTSMIASRLSSDIETLKRRYNVDVSISSSVPGHESPSLCRLSADKHLIVSESKERGYKFGELITSQLSSV
jgi:hypothetical protein